jgi:proteic killer suppression protein
MIGSFRDKRTRSYAAGHRVKAFDGIAKRLAMNLDQLDAATSLHDVSLPGNHLKALKSDRKGQFSIRVDDQWRVCFEWPKGTDGPLNVEVADYH